MLCKIRKIFLSSFIFLFSLGIIHSPIAFSATKTLLLQPFSMNEPKKTQTDFINNLAENLESKAFIITKSNVSPSSIRAAQDAALAQSKNAAVYGTILKIGNSFAIDAQYVNAVGRNIPIVFEMPIASTYEDIANRLADEVLVASKINPVLANAISEVRIQGNKNLDTSFILTRMNTIEGSAVPNTEELDREMRRIWNTGYFSDVKLEVKKENNNNILFVDVIERPVIQEIRVDGSDKIKVDDILKAMSLKKGIILNERLLASDIQKIQELYRKKGYYNVEITHDIDHDLDGNQILVFNVVEGKKLYIQNIVFDGLDGLKAKDLRKYLTLKERKFYSAITGSGTLKEEDLERDAQTIGAYAVNEGYIQAQVSAPEVIYGDEGITIIYKVNEGPRFKLGEITFNGELIADTSVLYDIIKIDDWKKDNTYFSLNTMQQDISSLRAYYASQGYAFAQAIMQEKVDAVNNIIDIEYVLIPNSKVSINRVDVSGNYKTRDNVILRELRIADGETYSSSKINRSRERLMLTNYFTNVDIKVIPTEDPSKVDLDIEVEENSTGTISGGIGYSTYDGVGISASVSQNNLFGKGYKLNIEGYASASEMNMTSSFYNPRVNNTNLGAGISLYGITQEWLEYDRDTIGGSFNLSYPIGEYTSFGGGYKLDNYEIYNVADDASSTIQEYEGNNWSSVLIANIVRNTTNSNFFATKGTKTKIRLEYGGNFLGGDDNYVKNLTEFGAYWGFAEKHALHARAAIGGVFQNTSKIVPTFERFYIGGMSTIRGYEYDELSPIDPSTSESIGADRVFYTSLEYAWLFEPSLGLMLVPFFDFAAASDSTQGNLFDKLYYSAGLEFRWRSPMGDLRFAYGYPLAKDVYGNEYTSGRFEFTIGQAF